MSTIQNPKIALLLDFIAVKESNGNYNAYIGHANSQSPNFADLTIAQVYDFQRTLLKRGLPSTAVGRYQFLQRTLSQCAQTLKYDVAKVHLDPLTQDNLALVLLNGRGYQSWLNGHLSAQQFAHNLSCEWASLPDPFNHGKSHYDGDGINHAGRTLAEVYACLKSAEIA